MIADVRFYLSDHARGRREYDTAHIPGAIFVDLHQDLADTTVTGAGRHPLPTTNAFARLLESLGVTPDSTVVAYDDQRGAMASRLWWMLDAIGHRDARVLDGGLAAWIEEGYPLTAEVPTSDNTDYPVPGEWAGTVSAATIGDDPDRPVTIVDSRAPERFRGDQEPLDPRAGHIPGAINRFHGDVVGPDGRFRSAAELASHFDGVGPSPVVYCGSGVTACHNLLAMRVAGIEGAMLYPGSWSEWSSDPARPAATTDPER